MGGTYGVPCPTLDIGNVSFPWTSSVTSSDPTSGPHESRDQQGMKYREEVDSCRTDDQTPDTVMAAPETSRDRSVTEDYGKTTDSDTRRVRSSDESRTGVADTSLPVSSHYEGVTCDVVTSQPKPEIVMEQEVLASGAGRLRFRDAALTITTHLREIDIETATTRNGDVAAQFGSSTTEDDVPDSVLTSTKTVLASDCASGGRRTLLEEILRARAKTQQVGAT